MKTIVYVDGYNLYYGRLKYSKYKWLDLAKLFSNCILSAHSPHANFHSLKYFTAEIKSKFSSRQHASSSQGQYHRALRSGLSGTVQIVNGFYTAEKSHAIAYRKVPDKRDRVEIWKLEEKQTDVQMALSMFSDAINEQCDQIVVCSNDSDLEPALSMVREQCSSAKIGLVVPRMDQRARHSRPPNARLAALADWVLPHITDADLACSQFPDTVPSKRKPAKKPLYW